MTDIPTDAVQDVVEFNTYVMIGRYGDSLQSVRVTCNCPDRAKSWEAIVHEDDPDDIVASTVDSVFTHVDRTGHVPDEITAIAQDSRSIDINDN